MNEPFVVIIAGCNGAGKSTCAPYLLPDLPHFLNADDIARGLPEVPEENREIRASRILLNEMERLETVGESFAVETTLASRSLAPRLRRLQAAGYRFHLFFFCLASPELAVARVAERVRRGKHDIPEPVIRRRYQAGIQNFFTFYQSLADNWQLFDNSVAGLPHPVVDGSRDIIRQVHDTAVWNALNQEGTMTMSETASVEAPPEESPLALPESLEDRQHTLKKVQQAVRVALSDHKAAGNPVASWQNSRVVIVPPEDIVIPE